MRKNKNTIVFDLDGTLYHFDGGSFKKSGLNKRVLINAKKYLKNKLDVNEKVAIKILKDIKKAYGENISLALEAKFGLDRYDYFNTIWNIPAKGYVKYNNKIKKLLDSLRKNFNLVILSDAPKIWVVNALKELKIFDIFKDKIFSGEGDSRKNLGNPFERIITSCKIKPNNCWVIGDQEETDIIPAKKVGLKTIFIYKNKKSKFADYNIKDILEIKKIFPIK